MDYSGRVEVLERKEEAHSELSVFHGEHFDMHKMSIGLLLRE